MKLFKLIYDDFTFTVAASNEKEAIKLILSDYAEEFDEDKEGDYQQIESCRVIEEAEAKEIVVASEGSEEKLFDIFSEAQSPQVLTVPRDLL